MVALAIGKDVILLSNGGEILSFMGVLEVPFTLFFVLVAEIWRSIMLTEIHFRFEFILSFIDVEGIPRSNGEEKEEAERGETNSHEKLRSRYSKKQKGRKYDFGKSKMQPQRYDSWRLQNCFPRSHPIICYFYFPHQFASRLEDFFILKSPI
ncbi:hypothetical protein DKX38_001926 [Salix brachista]|uniref:Uncharacterized protein n=1 Tax=Salix brachista TaxID=2182728 RepID=A0A5N5NN00_9ROSI|nr:hypothetical protein DKX38_001926 [Salix brachista]